MHRNPAICTFIKFVLTTRKISSRGKRTKIWAKSGPDWPGLDWPGLDWPGLDWPGLARPTKLKSRNAAACAARV